MAAAEGKKLTTITHSDELLRLPVHTAPEASKFLLTKDSQKSWPTKTFRVGQSSVLDRVRGFLPQMAVAEEKLKEELQTKPHSELDIENVDESGPFIEINLALVETEDGEESSSDEKVDSHDERDSDVDEIKINSNHTITEDNFVIRKSKTNKQKPVIEEIKPATKGKAKKQAKRRTLRK